MPRHPDTPVTPNTVLSEARERLPSPRRPGQCMSRGELADAVNATLDRLYPGRDLTAHYVYRSWIGKLERGEHRWPSEERRTALRQVLGAATDTELDLYSPRRTDGPPPPRVDVSAARPGTRVGEDEDVDRRTALRIVAAPALAELIAALMPTAGSGPTDTPARDREVGTLVARTNAVHRAYQDGRYRQALHDLPPLINQIGIQARDSEATAGVALGAQAYQIASGLLLKCDEPTLAAVAAERSLAAARSTGDPLLVASSMRAVVHGLAVGGHPDTAARVAESAAAALATETSLGNNKALSLYGALLLRGAIAAARGKHHDVANALLSEADAAARHVGRDANIYWTAFGPTNVRVHRVAVAVELGDVNTAIAVAGTVDLHQLAVPERKAMLLLDTARAYLQWAKFEQAFTTIRQAERHAPGEVRARPHTHRMLQDLYQRSPRYLRQQLREYIATMGTTA
ncbi:helix-turn-helix transcriptional regulator [Phytohabitans flavus]|uniref:Transcriptional regulator n=1 Tax=Phytohabitans flavus TaxID=1076124 RepID=A0A6F8XL61_9ACTN|nr:hypothetical protein [Phytohabitans flavus]BCB74547.1 transcriptional regulator [Phytohabitans flavus]